MRQCIVLSIRSHQVFGEGGLYVAWAAANFLSWQSLLSSVMLFSDDVCVASTDGQVNKDGCSDGEISKPVHIHNMLLRNELWADELWFILN